MTDLYAALGVPRDADTKAIRRAFRDKSKTLHPDAGGDTEAFQEIELAHRILSNPATRARYDKTGETEQPPSIEQKAMQALFGFMMEALAGAGEDANAPLLKQATAKAQRTRQEARDGVRQMMREQKKLRAAIARLKRKDGTPSKIALMFEAHAAMVENGIAQAREVMELMDRVLEEIKALEYESDQPKIVRAVSMEDAMQQMLGLAAGQTGMDPFRRGV